MEYFYDVQTREPSRYYSLTEVVKLTGLSREHLRVRMCSGDLSDCVDRFRSRWYVSQIGLERLYADDPRLRGRAIPGSTASREIEELESLI